MTYEVSSSLRCPNIILNYQKLRKNSYKTCKLEEQVNPCNSMTVILHEEE